MISGAAQADVCLLMVPADGNFTTAIQKGDHKAGEIQGQTRQHARLLNLLGVRQLIVGINKMDSDTAGYKQVGAGGWGCLGCELERGDERRQGAAAGCWWGSGQLLGCQKPHTRRLASPVRTLSHCCLRCPVPPPPPTPPTPPAGALQRDCL